MTKFLTFQNILGLAVIILLDKMIGVTDKIIMTLDNAYESSNANFPLIK